MARDIDFLEPEHFEFLKTVSIFNELTDEELKHVAGYLYIKQIGENETVFARLSTEQVLYVVRFGKLKLELPGQDDKIYEKGDVFGEITVLNHHFRSGTIKAVDPSLLFCLSGRDLFNEKKLPPKIALKIVVEVAKIITRYLTTVENTSTHTLIENGENDYVEFKSTLRYNLYTKKFDKEMEHAALKTIAAFMNSSGGTLIIGVDDDKNILGLKNDKFKDDDKTLLHLTKLIQERIGMQHTSFVRAVIEGTDGSKILRVDVKPSNVPAYLTHNNEEIFYVRTGPATAQMKVSEIYSYIKSRFYNH
jgi:signal-transduction protein with cAMP-binding, CBS, and nucleotidyltransferase domain